MRSFTMRQVNRVMLDMKLALRGNCYQSYGCMIRIYFLVISVLTG